MLGTTSDYSFCSLFLDNIFFCWALQVIICFVICLGLHIFLFGTASDYLFHSLFLDYMMGVHRGSIQKKISSYDEIDVFFRIGMKVWACQVIICFIVVWRNFFLRIYFRLFFIV